MTRFPQFYLFLFVLVLGFSACGDDDDTPNNPVIGTVTDIVIEDERFSTLEEALGRTDLAGRLDVPTVRYTVFAPTNDAFSAAGIDLASLSDEELASILSYHVVAGSLNRSTDLEEGDTELESFNTLAPGGNALELDVNNSGGSLSVNGVSVDETDITAVNGVIHVINELLIPPTIADRAVADGRFTILLAGLERAGLAEQFMEALGSFTVFAPTDDAFTAAGITSADGIPEDELRDLLLYHVLPNGVAASDIPGGISYQMTAANYGPDTSNLSLQLTNEADSILINGDAQVVAADVFATNGVIHAIDMVLETQAIVDFVTMNPELDSLTGALVATGLAAGLELEDGPITVLAPDNAAFAAAADTIATFGVDTIRDVLNYHIIDGNVRSGDLEAGPVTTENGQDIEVVINQDDDGEDLAPVLISADSTQVEFIINDIQATNGVIHIIDGVLLPEIE